MRYPESSGVWFWVACGFLTIGRARASAQNQLVLLAQSMMDMHFSRKKIQEKLDFLLEISRAVWITTRDITWFFS